MTTLLGKILMFASVFFLEYLKAPKDTKVILCRKCIHHSGFSLTGIIVKDNR